jgi:hypothetical protein
MKMVPLIELPGNIRILSDSLNWVLQVGSKNNRTYFHTLDDLCDELLDLKIRTGLGDVSTKGVSLVDIVEVIREARESVRGDLDRIQFVLKKADRRRASGELFENGG